MQTMSPVTTPRLALLLVLLPLSAAAVVDPQLARDATPEVVVCCISDVVSREGEERSSHSARCAVREVVRSTVEIRPGDDLTIAYQVVHAVYDEPQPATPGPARPTPPAQLEDGDVVTAYLRTDQDAEGETIFVPNIGIDSFEVLPEGDIDDAACPAPDGIPELATPLEEADLATCTEDSDCVVVDHQHCCGASKRAIHRDHIDAYEANPEWQVFDDPTICAMGGICRDDSDVTEARCIRDAEAATGRCELVFP